MATKAQLVREALMAEIVKVSALKTADYLPPRTPWRDEPNVPAAYLILEDDDSVPAPTRSKEVTALFRIVTIIRSARPQDAFDELRGAFETEIEDDPSLGGVCGGGYGAWVSGCSRFGTAKTVAGDVYVRDVFVTVEYRHDRGAP